MAEKILDLVFDFSQISNPEFRLPYPIMVYKLSKIFANFQGFEVWVLRVSSGCRNIVILRKEEDVKTRVPLQKHIGPASPSFPIERSQNCSLCNLCEFLRGWNRRNPKGIPETFEQKTEILVLYDLLTSQSWKIFQGFETWVLDLVHAVGISVAMLKKEEDLRTRALQHIGQESSSFLRTPTFWQREAKIFKRNHNSKC